MKRTILLGMLIGALFLGSCCLTPLFASGIEKIAPTIENLIPTLMELIPTSTPQATITPLLITEIPPSVDPVETLNLLNSTIVPQGDLYLLACELKSICDVPLTLDPPGIVFQIGRKQNFWVNNSDTNKYIEVPATLRYVTPHVYFWVEDKAQYDEQEMKQLVETFEKKIYPTDREFFGSEWTPGVDGDAHIYILYSSELGSGVAGYFYSPDEYNPKVRQFSNAHEMFYISTSESLAADYTYGALAHEFQHMIHWYQDSNEGAFLNEGFAELATFLNGYNNGQFDYFYSIAPDMTLTDWQGEAMDNTAHYGANFLFVTYFLDRFGEDITKALIHDQQNGMESIDNVFSQNNVIDKTTGKVISADDFFLDWTIANYLHDGSIADGRYEYKNYRSAPQTRDTETISNCPVENLERTVNQYGVDYIKIDCPGDHTINIQGAQTVRLLPTDFHSGTYAYWSNKGDNSDMTLSKQFDFTNIQGAITFSYWIWYDIEKDFDYAFLEASTDGLNWEVLSVPSGTTTNPNGASYGSGYTGKSSRWIEETVDLSQFAGKSVSLKFEYITDPNVNGGGLLIDDISIPAINYSCDFESEACDWTASGFVRIENSIPQTYRLALISHNLAGNTVSLLSVNSDQTISIPISIGTDVYDVVLVVTATARYTIQNTTYTIGIR